MFEIYLWSVLVTFICMMIVSWYDTKPRNIKVEDVFNSVLFSFLPILNVVLSVYSVWYISDRNKGEVLFGAKE